MVNTRAEFKMNDKYQEAQNQQQKIRESSLRCLTHSVHDLPLCPVALLLVRSHDRKSIILL